MIFLLILLLFLAVFALLFFLTITFAVILSILFIIYFFISVIVSLVIYYDAKKLGINEAYLWAIAAIAFGFIKVTYVYMRYLRPYALELSEYLN